MRFQDIFGHEKAKELLINSVSSNKLSHAYILEGNYKVGKLSVALALSALVLCENNKDNVNFDSCGECKACTMIKSGTHPDVRIVTNELYGIQKTSKIIAVDTIREMKNEVYTKSYMGGRKFFIIPNSENMNVNAQNSLLKVLEEPPEYTTIILLCENSNALLETILSRAVLIRLNPLKKEQVREYLTRNFANSADEAQISFAVNSSNGSIGYARELLQNEELRELQNKICEYFFGIVNADYTSMYGFILFLKKNNSDIDFVLSYMSSFLRDMLISKQKREEYSSLNGEKLCGIYSRISSGQVMKLLDIVLKYPELISKNVSYKIAVHNMVLEIWEVING